jgi:hypothetical protein
MAEAPNALNAIIDPGKAQTGDKLANYQGTITVLFYASVIFNLMAIGILTFRKTQLDEEKNPGATGTAFTVLFWLSVVFIAISLLLNIIADIYLYSRRIVRFEKDNAGGYQVETTGRKFFLIPVILSIISAIVVIGAILMIGFAILQYISTDKFGVVYVSIFAVSLLISLGLIVTNIVLIIKSKSLLFVSYSQ